MNAESLDMYSAFIFCSILFVLFIGLLIRRIYRVVS